MKDYAGTPTNSTPNLATSVVKSKRSGGASFVNNPVSNSVSKSKKSLTESVASPTPVADLEPIKQTQKEHSDEISKMKELVLKLSNKFKKVSEWKLEA